jgi:glyoxylase-like metal-dependent hydrolase (beta-lactamase superfamily II)
MSVESPAAIAGLHAIGPESLPFARSLAIRAFLLERAAGNLLIYNTPGLAENLAAAGERGGVARRYLNHWHEAMFDPGALRAPLFVHAADRAEVEAQGRHVRGAFSKRHVLDDDFEVIPTPGHTRGTAAYLWDTGEHRLLFTGDTIYLDDGEWVAAVLRSSDRDAYVESLERLRELEFDVLVPWAATSGQPYYAATDPADARRRIGAILERARRGAEH